MDWGIRFIGRKAIETEYENEIFMAGGMEFTVNLLQVYAMIKEKHTEWKLLYCQNFYKWLLRC